MGSLLAVDLGLKSGLALFNRDGTLAWYRSHNFGSRERLKRGIPGILETIPDISAIVMEGGGNLATVWEKGMKCHDSVRNRNAEKRLRVQFNLGFYLSKKNKNRLFFRIMRDIVKTR